MDNYIWAKTSTSTLVSVEFFPRVNEIPGLLSWLDQTMDDHGLKTLKQYYKSLRDMEWKSQ